MRPLNEILKNILATQSILGQLTTDDPRVAAAYAIRHTDESAKLARLQAEYRTTIKENLVGILLVAEGAKMKRFCEVAARELPIVALSANALYDLITTDVERTLGRAPTKEAPLDFGSLQMRETFASMRRECSRLDINFTLGQPPRVAALCSTTDVRRNVRNAVRAANGDIPNLSFILDAVATQALVEKINDPVVTVVLTGVLADEAESLAKLFPKGHLVVNDLPGRDRITGGVVMGVFEALRDIVKNKNE